MSPVLLVIDRGLTRGPLPLRDVFLVGEETLLHHNDISAGLAEQIAEWFAGMGVPIEDVLHPLPGLEKPDTTAESRRPKRRKAKD